jgi:alkylation response protein AidB-like acyl-CoA dehydrogenase
VAGSSGNYSFDAFRLSDEHNELGTVLRELCEKEIAPYAGDVDATARYTDEALAAHDSSEFSAVHIPEQYGGGAPMQWPPASSSKRWRGCARRRH